MNKTEFIQELRQELGGETTSREAEQVLDAVLNTIARSVQRKSQVKFRGFGTFGIKRRQARVSGIRAMAANCSCMNQAP